MHLFELDNISVSWLANVCKLKKTRLRYLTVCFALCVQY